MIVRDFTAKASNGKHNKRSLGLIQNIIVHRLGPKAGITVNEVTESFLNTDKYAAGSYTNGQQPYHFWVDVAGRAYQLIPLDEVGWHALRWSKNSVGIACSGDFRISPPTDAQLQTLTGICLALVLWIGDDWKIFGHTELPGATLDLGKECPGKFMDIPTLRKAMREVTEKLVPLGKPASTNLIQAFGIVL